MVIIISDGKVVIDVDLDSKDAIKSADKLGKKLDGAFQDKNGRWRAANGRFLTMKERSDLLGKSVGKIEGQGSRAALGIGKIVTSLGLVALGAKAIDMVTGALDGAISRYDTLNNFPRVLQLMGFDAEDSSKAMDKLSKGIEGLPTTLDSVASTAQRIAIMTGDLDGATETTLALNNAFLASGSSAADAQRGLEQYVQMLSRGEVDLESWRSLQETMPVALNETAKAFGFTGKSAQNDLYDALKDGRINFDDFNSRIVELSNKTGGFADMARESSGGIKTSWQNMKTAIVKGVTDVIGAIDESLGGVGSIAGIFDNAKVGIKAFFDFIVASIPVAVGWLTAIKDAIEPWLPTIQNVIKAVQDILISRLTTAIDFAKQIFASLKDFWQQNGQQILDNAITIFTGIWETVQTAFDAVYNIISDVLGSKVIPFIQSTLDYVQQFWQENGTQIMEAVKNAFEFIQSVIEFVMPAIQFVIEYVWAAIQGIISGALDIIMGLVQVFTGIFTGDWSQLWEGIKKILKGAVDLILGIMSLNFLGAIRKVLTNLLKSGVEIVKNMWKSIVNFFKTFTDDAASKVSSMGSRVWTFVKNMATNFKNTIVGLKSDVVKRFQEIKDDIINKVKSIDLKQIGKDIIQGLINGIGSMASAVWEKAKSIAEGIGNSIKKILGIASPSKLMIQFGEWTGEGLEIGMGSMLKDIQRASEALGKAASPRIKSSPETRAKDKKIMELFFKLGGRTNDTDALSLF